MTDDPFYQILLMLFLLGVATLGATLFFYYQRLRRREFFLIASDLKLRYEYISYGLPRRMGLLYQLRRGKNRHASNIITGRYKGALMYLFDYHYSTTGDNKSKSHHCFSIAMMRHDQPLPEVRIYPPDILEKVRHMADIDNTEISVEEDSFFQHFKVKTSDPGYAHEFCNNAFKEYMLRHADMSVEVGRDWIATSIQQRLKPEEIQRRLEQLIKIQRFLPARSR